MSLFKNNIRESPGADIMYDAVKRDYRHLFVLLIKKRENIYANDPQQCHYARNINKVITVTLMVLETLSEHTNLFSHSPGRIRDRTQEKVKRKDYRKRSTQQRERQNQSEKTE